jgi:DNA-binding response OmpR family regulator
MALSGIRKIKRKKYVPVIAITGYASTDDKNDILNSGFDAYLPKPFDKNNLLYLLEDLKHRGGKHGD